MKLCIIGLGLLGGSLALATKAAYADTHVLGVDANEANAQKALALGLADQLLPLQEAVPLADLTVLAVPVNTIVSLLPIVLDLLPAAATLMDLGSTKEQICQVADKHKKRAQYVAAHPIAGTEYSGPEAAFATLLQQKTMIICDSEKSAPDSLSKVEQLCRDLSMPLRHMPAAEHDLHLAYVSHLSHISSFALGITVLAKEQDEKNIFDMAGSGFSSTVRLAKSSPAMWAPIFTQNKQNITSALDSYMEQLQQFRSYIAAEDEAGTTAMMSKANGIRRILG